MRFLLIWGLVISLGSAASIAQSSGLSPEQREAILGFPLTLDRANHLIAAMTAVTQYLVSQPDYLNRMAQSAKLTTAERIAQMEKDPQVAGILKQESLTARDYLVGVPALRMSLLAAQGASGPNVVASPANLAFAKANLATLKPKMDQADGGGRR
jgi:hypothetical protein